MGYIDAVIILILVWQNYVSNLSFDYFTEDKVLRIEILGISGSSLIRYFLQIIFIILLVFLTVCFLTLLERKISGYVQNRKGPNKVIFIGLLQPVIDGGKLIIKRILINKIYYFFIPFISIVVIRLLGLMISFYRVRIIMTHRIFYILIVRSLIVYVLFILGWRRENVYGVLGGLRRSSQMVAYEIIIFFVIILLVIYFYNWNINIITFLFFIYVIYLLFDYWFC